MKVFLKKVITKLKSILLDANVVIELHSFEIWYKFIAKYKIYLSSIVIRTEAQYYYDKNGEKTYYDLEKDLTEKKIAEISYPVLEMEKIKIFFISKLGIELHDGESEAIAFLLREDAPDISFCTGDKDAIRAMVLLGKSEKLISLEEALMDCGLSHQVKKHYTQQFLKKLINEYQIEKITWQDSISELLERR